MPVKGAKEALERLHKDWWLYIYTTRAKSRDGRRAIGAWLRRHGIPFDEVVASKPIAFAYIDDRAIRFETWRQTLSDLQSLSRVDRQRLANR